VPTPRRVPQFFLLAPFIALLTVWNHVVSVVVLVLACVASIAYAWVEAYRQNWSIDFLSPSTYFADYYIAPWFVFSIRLAKAAGDQANWFRGMLPGRTRVPAYLIGILLAIWWTYYVPHAQDLPNRVGPAARRPAVVSRKPSSSFWHTECIVERVRARGAGRYEACLGVTS
jgi:hypothetical protein